MPPITETNPIELRTIVRNERRVELALEGIRYWDLVRTNQAKDFIKGWDDTKKYLPIPQSRLISRMAIWYRTLISKN